MIDDPRLSKYFWRSVVPEPMSGCWLWVGGLTRGGYGKANRRPRKRVRNKTWIAHRLAYTILIGEIPRGLQIDHKCRVRCCVNPEHLEAVTPVENIRRANVANQHKFGTCREGHKIDATNRYPTSTGFRCLICKREKNRINEARKRALAKKGN